MSAETDTFRHAPGCAYADWNDGGGGDEETDHATANERDALRRLSLGRSPAGQHTDVYCCRECAAKGSLD
ncbi:hypothetical protein BRC86_11060 [Halobacteriales archaeon QS_3_64_16]|nr:MAG: hypothetical protein BRC86_11060 [Halobacteriales archaeon QS_3_64_16]